MTSTYERRPNADIRRSNYRAGERKDPFSRGLKCETCGDARTNYSVALCRTCLAVHRKLEESGGFSRSSAWYDTFAIGDSGELVICKTRLHGDIT